MTRPSPGLLAGLSVLVVEDEFLVLMVTEELLADLGCEAVSAAPTVARALALVAAQAFDLAMLDMNLDGDKPFAIADALAARGVPFLFATGYDGRDLREGYRDRPVLRKPFGAAELGRALAGLLGRDGEGSPPHQPAP